MKSCLALAPVLVVVLFCLSCVSLFSRNSGHQVDDIVITTQANGLIIQNPKLNYMKIDVTTLNGDVVLTGSVPNQDAERELIGRIKEIKGVKSVISYLKIDQNV